MIALAPRLAPFAALLGSLARFAGLLGSLLVAAGCGELELFVAADAAPPEDGRVCVPRTCQDLRVECGPVGDGCGGEMDCGSCEEGACGAVFAGLCPEAPACPLAPGEERLLGEISPRAEPIVLDTSPTHLAFFTAFPTGSSPGQSTLRHVSKCGGEVVEVADGRNGDTFGGGHTLDVFGRAYYFATTRFADGDTVWRGAPDTLEVGVLGGIPRPCTLAVDAARGRLLVARCEREEEAIVAVPLGGGPVETLVPGERTTRRRLVASDEAAWWVREEPPAIRRLSLGEPAAPVTLAEEEVPPLDLVVLGGQPWWLRPLPEGGRALVTLADGAPLVRAELPGEPEQLAAHGGGIFLVDAGGVTRVDALTGELRSLSDLPGDRIVVDADDVVQPHSFWAIAHPD